MASFIFLYLTDLLYYVNLMCVLLSCSGRSVHKLITILTSDAKASGRVLSFSLSSGQIFSSRVKYALQAVVEYGAERVAYSSGGLLQGTGNQVG